ncbi:hypothetical protein AAZX31_15G131600 [Glycine max]
MRPKDGFFDKGPYKGGFLMHVTSSNNCKVTMTMVNPLRRIGRCDQNESISGSEIGADNSPAGAASF